MIFLEIVTAVSTKVVQKKRKSVRDNAKGGLGIEIPNKF